MSHFQKGFTNIALIIVIVAFFGVIGYFTLVRQANALASLTPTLISLIK